MRHALIALAVLGLSGVGYADESFKPFGIAAGTPVDELEWTSYKGDDALLVSIKPPAPNGLFPTYMASLSVDRIVCKVMALSIEDDPNVALGKLFETRDRLATIHTMSQRLPAQTGDSIDSDMEDEYAAGKTVFMFYAQEPLPASIERITLTSAKSSVSGFNVGLSYTFSGFDQCGET